MVGAEVEVGDPVVVAEGACIECDEDRRKYGIDDGVKRLLATSRDDTFELGLPWLVWESR